METSMIWIGLVITVISLGPIVWLFYRNGRQSKKLYKHLEMLAQRNGWAFDLKEANGKRLCAIDTNHKVLVMIRVTEKELSSTVSTLKDIDALHFEDGESDSLEFRNEPCEMTLAPAGKKIRFLFYEPGVDNLLLQENLMAYGKRWYTYARKYAEWQKTPGRQEPRSSFKSLG